MKLNLRKEWFTAVFVGTLASLLIAESLLHLAGVSYPIFETVDPVLGTALIPRAEGLQTREGRAYVRINSHGFRDLERSKVKPPGTLRVAVLGDSFTEARQVDLRETFCAVLERELDSRGLLGSLGVRDIEVLNFGVSGHGTTQQWLLLRHRIWDYEPDVVLLAVFTGNDISDNSASLGKNIMAPYSVYRDGKLMLDRSFVDTEAYRRRRSWGFRAMHLAVRFSRTLQLINHLRLVRKLGGPSRRLGVAGSLAFLEQGLTEELYQRPASQEWREAWRVTEALITRMHREAEQREARFLVVTLSNGIQVHPDAARRGAFMEKAGVEDLFYPDRRIRNLGEREGFPVLMLAPRFQAYAQQEGVFLHGFDTREGFGHWNEAGHELAGRLIACWMTDHRLTAPSNVLGKSGF